MKKIRILNIKDLNDHKTNRVFQKMLLLILFCFFYFLCYSQSNILKLDLKKDFGAKGDGKTNDQKAFEKASSFICNRVVTENQKKYRGYVNLYIPAGIYIVGFQKNMIGKITKSETNFTSFLDSNYPDIIGTYQGAPSFKFYSDVASEKVKNVRIVGDKNKTIIKFEDKMYFGTFDPITGEIPENLNKYNRVENNINFYLDSSGNEPLNKKYNEMENPYHVPFNSNPIVSSIPKAYVGDIFYFSNKSYYENIKISNLILDGNSSNYILGGNIGLPANKKSKRYIETYSGGIQAYNVTGLYLDNLLIKNFGLDGILLRGNLTKDSMSSCNYITLNNVTCTKNGRGGLAVANVNYLNAYNCHFDENATTKLSVNPGFGVDLEPENPPVCNTNFYNCTFLKNGGIAVSMGYPNIPSSYNHRFTHCIFLADNENLAIANASDGCIFEECKIFGSVLDYGEKFGKNEPNIYNNCYFNDVYYGKKVISNKEFLWSCKKNSTLNNCIFKYSYTNRAIYCAPISDSKTGKLIPSKAEMVLIKNCRFYNYNKTNKSFADKSEAAIFERNIFYYPKYKPFVILCTNTPPFEMNIDKGNGLILK